MTISLCSCEATFHITPTFNMTQAYFYVKGYFPLFATHNASGGKQIAFKSTMPPKNLQNHIRQGISYTFTVHWVYLVYYKLWNRRSSQISLRTVIFAFHINNFLSFSIHQFEYAFQDNFHKNCLRGRKYCRACSYICYKSGIASHHKNLQTTNGTSKENWSSAVNNSANKELLPWCFFPLSSRRSSVLVTAGQPLVSHTLRRQILYVSASLGPKTCWLIWLDQMAETPAWLCLPSVQSLCFQRKPCQRFSPQKKLNYKISIPQG